MTKDEIAQREDRLKEARKYAQMGQQVLNNEAYRSAMTVRKADLFTVFCDTNRDQGEEREEAWRTMQNLKALEQYFADVLNSGNMADNQLNELESFKKTRN